MMVAGQPLLLKLPLLAAMAGGVSIAFTSPQPPPSRKETGEYEDGAPEPVKGLHSWGAAAVRFIPRSAQLIESALILYKVFPVLRDIPLPTWIRPSLSTFAQVDNLRITPSFVVGTALICLGAYVRTLCFRTLGPQFTFQLSIKEDHRLVTDGPYSVVRHPAYGGGVIQLIGMLACLGGPGSWFREIGVYSTSGRVAGATAFAMLFLCLFGAIARTYPEDVVLRKTFKEEWDEYVRRTPYRIIPYVY
ncbi:hypothetical protein BDW22DRAFT_1349725 [Trametopsis cervina]|nr:hypothetical protein BDW22DRAFT_1349725 [Trametopsis cervina]